MVPRPRLGPSAALRDGARARTRGPAPHRAARRAPHRATHRTLHRAVDRLLDPARDLVRGLVQDLVQDLVRDHLLDPKRLLDLTLGTLLLILTAPLLAATALALALSARHPGAAFTHGPRVGLDGRVFTVRSLATRRHRLDLLSRLPHVVRGEMSLVGPAPLPPGDPRTAAPWRQHVRPGLTGLAQVRRRSPWPWDEPALLDQHYVEHHWIGLDLAILARTPAAATAPCGADAAAPRIPAQGHLSDTDHRPRGYSAAG